MSTLLYRLAHWCVRRRRIVLAAWLTALIGAVALAVVADGEASSAFEMPGTESQAAADLLADRFPSESGSPARLVFTTSDGSSLAEPLYADANATMLEDPAQRPDLAAVADPFEPGTNRADAATATT